MGTKIATREISFVVAPKHEQTIIKKNTQETKVLPIFSQTEK